MTMIMIILFFAFLLAEALNLILFPLVILEICRQLFLRIVKHYSLFKINDDNLSAL